MIGVPENIKFLILKWRQRKLNDVERSELDNWYNSPLPETLKLEDETEQHMKARLFKQIQHGLGEEQKIVSKSWPNWIKIAATICLVFGATLIGNYYYHYTVDQNKPVISLATREETKKIILPDGSIVWLKKGSKFSYPETFGTTSRNVTLDGEAFFEIAHDKRWPFKITSGQYTTTVLGTSFNLKSSTTHHQYSLAVITGKVEVAKKGKFEQSTRYIVAADHFFNSQEGKVREISPVNKDEQIQELIKGTQYDMAFVKTPFEEIMRRFEQKFDVQFDGYTGEYNSCALTADLTNLSLEKSLQIICSSINATYKIDHNKIKLTGGGCF